MAATITDWIHRLEHGVGFVVVRGLDIDGLPRFNDEPDVPDSGNGTAPIVDRGAHEFGEFACQLHVRSPG